MVKWGLITFGIGMILLVWDVSMARKKKGGISPTDRQRFMGIFWISVFAAGLVAGLIWMA